MPHVQLKLGEGAHFCFEVIGGITVPEAVILPGITGAEACAAAEGCEAGGDVFRWCDERCG